MVLTLAGLACKAFYFPGRAWAWSWWLPIRLSALGAKIRTRSPVNHGDLSGNAGTGPISSTARERPRGGPETPPNGPFKQTMPTSGSFPKAELASESRSADPNNGVGPGGDP